MILLDACMAIKFKSNQTLFTSSRSGNIYTIKLHRIPSNDVCLLSNGDGSCIWHKRVSYIHMDHLSKLVCKNLIIDFPNLCFKKMDYVMCSKRVNKKIPQLNLKILFLQIGNYNYCIGIFLHHP